MTCWPPVMKVASSEARKVVAYGSLGGARAVEHLRLICAELQMATVRQQLAFSLFTDFENFTVFAPAALHGEASATLFTQLESWAGALKTLRAWHARRFVGVRLCWPVSKTRTPPSAWYSSWPEQSSSTPDAKNPSTSPSTSSY